MRTILVLAFIALAVFSVAEAKKKNKNKEKEFDLVDSCPTGFAGPFTSGGKSFCAYNQTDCVQQTFFDAAKKCESVNSKLCSISQYLSLYGGSAHQGALTLKQKAKNIESQSLKGSISVKCVENENYWATANNDFVDQFGLATIPFYYPYGTQMSGRQSVAQIPITGNSLYYTNVFIVEAFEAVSAKGAESALCSSATPVNNIFFLDGQTNVAQTNDLGEPLDYYCCRSLGEEEPVPPQP